MTQSVWIINPYGSLPFESWATYRSTMLARCLAAHGYTVTQFISNFEHRSKTFRTAAREVIPAGDRYVIEVIPSTSYGEHISLRRVRYERTFARNLLSAVASRRRPDFIVLAEPSLFYYDILLRPLLRQPDSALLLDVIDIWPELFALVLPRGLRRWSGFLLAPLYFWRRRLYRRADAVVAVASDYLEIARRLVRRPDIPLEVVYWSYDNDRTAADSAALARVQDLVSRKQPGEVWALYAGTLGENYDIPAIVSLAQRLPANLKDSVALRFIVAGDGPLKQLCLDSASDAFIFLGRLGPADLALLHQHSDIALSTYHGESTVAMPIKAFDYLRYGLPIINSLGRDLGEMIRAHEIGINYDASRPSSLADAVTRLACDAPLRRRMSSNARALAGSFSADRQYGKFVRVLEAVSAQRRARIQ
jgi:glycosyltransferase involved in cell wall biosynthesis